MRMHRNYSMSLVFYKTHGQAKPHSWAIIKIYSTRYKQNIYIICFPKRKKKNQRKYHRTKLTKLAHVSNQFMSLERNRPNGIFHYYTRTCIRTYTNDNGKYRSYDQTHIHKHYIISNRHYRSFGVHTYNERRSTNLLDIDNSNQRWKTIVASYKRHTKFTTFQTLIMF